MCGSLSEEGAALKVFISKLQSQLSDSLSEANGLRGTAKSREAKVFELMSEAQMHRGQIDELQVNLTTVLPLNFSGCTLCPLRIAVVASLRQRPATQSGL